MGPPGEGKEGGKGEKEGGERREGSRRGRESRNAQIQSWQAYLIIVDKIPSVFNRIRQLLFVGLHDIRTPP